MVSLHSMVINELNCPDSCCPWQVRTFIVVAGVGWFIIIIHLRCVDILRIIATFMPALQAHLCFIRNGPVKVIIMSWQVTVSADNSNREGGGDLCAISILSNSVLHITFILRVRKTNYGCSNYGDVYMFFLVADDCQQENHQSTWCLLGNWVNFMSSERWGTMKGLLGSSGEEDPATDRTPLVPELAFNSYQAEDLVIQEHEETRAEFFGPSSKLCCNYHPGLNAQKCDAQGKFLQANSLAPPCAEKALDDWTPFCSWLEFELANFLFMHTEMPARKIDMLLDIWAMLLIGLDLYHDIDSTHIGNVKWDSFTIQYTGEDQQGVPVPWMFDSYEVWCCDPCKVIHSILMSPKYADKLDYVPYQEYDVSNNERCWQDFMAGDWAWEEVDRILSNNPIIAGATLVPIILGSGKMTVPETVLFSDNYYCNWHPKCLGHHDNLDEDALQCSHEHCDTIIEEFKLCQLWDSYGIVGDIVLIKGGFKDHLGDWVEQYLVHVHGKAKVEKILDDIDQQYIHCFQLKACHNSLALQVFHNFSSEKILKKWREEILFYVG
ncbi:hypothetical protein EDD16DRAFT_1521955 [Pisolithus croceorrhizus]|nr:hypothetical protein EDD16DRAFT_1521955 [Pisolithus croceorrhizus]KAI6119290.1 hypothetical protein EV401DRAFT_1888276 [Pisolithus croceorrhizus]KAI6165140.1 hypothetical protein EDD17DRAFT_1506011 [Pisolithus thermaeus]